MGSYLLHQLNDAQYDYLVLCLTYESILNYLDQLESDLQNKRGKLLVDQLLVTGNGRNRFIACDFRDGEIILSTAKNIKPDNIYKELTTKLLQQNSKMLKCSILSDHQRELILEGQSF